MNGQVDFLPEEKLEEIFSFLDPFVKNGVEYAPHFSYGDEEDLNTYLASVEESEIYPLIWYVFPTEELHGKKDITLSNLTLILALKNTNQQLNKDRLNESFKLYLTPLLKNIKKLFTEAQNIEVLEDIYRVSKFTNYGTNKKSESTDIWDAYRVSGSIRINEFCHRLKKD